MPHFSLEIADRVKETSTTSGTGTLSLAGAKTGFQAFSVLGDGKRTQYGITNAAGDFEIGIGTYTTSGTTLSRDFIFDSSNSGNKVNFSAAEKDVFVTLPADRAGVISAIDISSASGTVAGTQSIIPETTGGFTLGAVFLGNSTTTISGTVVVFDNASYMIADTAYTNEISPYIVDGTISSTSVAIGGFNVAGNVTISGNVEVIDATSHAVLNLGNTVTLNA